MRSTKYDKKGSFYGDLVQPLEKSAYADLRECEAYCANKEHVTCFPYLKLLRREIPEIVKIVTQFMCVVDDVFNRYESSVFIEHFWESGDWIASFCVSFNLQKHILKFNQKNKLYIRYIDSTTIRAESINDWKVNFPAYLESRKKNPYLNFPIPTAMEINI